jgi:CBS domain-containing protein
VQRTYAILAPVGGLDVAIVDDPDHVVPFAERLSLHKRIKSDSGAGNGAGEKQVSEVMASHLVTATPETTIRQAANLLRGRTIGCLPVLYGDKPVGIVTTTDLLDLVGRGAERPIERSTRWTLRGRGARRASPTARRARRG